METKAIETKELTLATSERDLQLIAVSCTNLKQQQQVDGNLVRMVNDLTHMDRIYTDTVNRIFKPVNIYANGINQFTCLTSTLIRKMDQQNRIQEVDDEMGKKYKEKRKQKLSEALFDVQKNNHIQNHESLLDVLTKRNCFVISFLSSYFLNVGIPTCSSDQILMVPRGARGVDGSCENPFDPKDQKKCFLLHFSTTYHLMKRHVKPSDMTCGNL